MIELMQSRAAACFFALSVGVGLVACSSGSDANGANAGNSATGGSGSTSSGATGDDGGENCTGDPRAEAFSLGMTQKSTKGLFTFVIASALYNPPAVADQSWTIKLLDASGQPVKDAVLSFPPGGHPADPWMPDHGHGALPAKATNNGDGTYTVSPLYFFMSGLWSLFIQAESGTMTDSTTFTFCIGD